MYTAWTGQSIGCTIVELMKADEEEEREEEEEEKEQERKELRDFKGMGV